MVRGPGGSGGDWAREGRAPWPQSSPQQDGVEEEGSATATLGFRQSSTATAVAGRWLVAGARRAGSRMMVREEAEEEEHGEGERGGGGGRA